MPRGVADAASAEPPACPSKRPVRTGGVTLRRVDEEPLYLSLM